MKFVCFDDGAVAEMISGRELQSVDFQQGRELINSLKQNIQLFRSIGKVIVTLDKDGMYYSTEGSWKEKKFLVVDCETSLLFSHLRESETLVSLQKLLRFCTRLWSKQVVFNSSEKMIAGTTKSILFPLPFSASSGFRIAVEREPMPERLQKRDMAGKFLLVYKSGTDGANSATEEADIANFKKAFEFLPSVYSDISTKLRAAEEKNNQSSNKQLKETSLSSLAHPLGETVFLEFEDWLPLLTKKQLDFLSAPATIPQRLIGAAGTGKTLTLLLRTVHLLKAAEYRNQTLKALFVTHSEATRLSVLDNLAVTDEDGFHTREPSAGVSLTVLTLASLCAEALKQNISPSEFVDRDAQDSKLLQEMYIEQAISGAIDKDLKSYSPHLSETFRNFLRGKSTSELAPLFQHEISVQIKGRAGESFDIYKNCPALKYGLPVASDADKGFVFTVYNYYQNSLISTSQFDTDDVVLSAIGQLDTPIWRRRRAREGYDFIAIDEAHLFNINELHVFHHFTKEIGSYPISFAVDRSQAVGDRGWESNDGLATAITADAVRTDMAYETVFRSSPEILQFSASILASGATLFTNFENNLVGAQSGFTIEDERRSQPLIYRDCVNDADMIDVAFRRAGELAELTSSKPWDILITSLSEYLCEEIKQYAVQKNKPVTYLDRRGDYSRVAAAKKAGHFVAGHADYVGGLEFNVVIIIGVDKGRVPFEGKSTDSDSRNFSQYTAHNRLYVAASRARFALELLGVKGRGPSEILDSAIDKGILSRR